MQQSNRTQAASFEVDAPVSAWNKLLEQWYRLAAVPEPDATATFTERELAQKMRSLSLAVLTIWIIFILFIPGALVLPNSKVLYADFGMMPICLIALFVNKKFRQPVLAGGLVTFCFEMALAAVCLTTWPFDEPSLQQYELFVLGEIMALTLISPNGMRLVGFANAVFISADLILQPHTAILNHDLQIQFAAILMRPVSLQIMVAVVVSAHSDKLIRTTKRANRAQMVAALEHYKVETTVTENKNLTHVTEGIEQIAKQYVNILNNIKQRGRPTLHEETKINDAGLPIVLKPISNGYNLLLARLRSATEQVQESERLQQAILYYTDQIQAGHFAPDAPDAPPLRPTHTILDPLLAAWRDHSVSRPTWFGHPHRFSTRSTSYPITPRPRAITFLEGQTVHTIHIQDREKADYEECGVNWWNEIDISENSAIV